MIAEREARQVNESKINVRFGLCHVYVCMPLTFQECSGFVGMQQLRVRMAGNSRGTVYMYCCRSQVFEKASKVVMDATEDGAPGSTMNMAQAPGSTMNMAQAPGSTMNMAQAPGSTMNMVQAAGSTMNMS